LLRVRVVSGDALECQKSVCQQVREAEADYLVALKANQPDLLEDITLLFREPPPGERFLMARTVTKHGGRLECVIAGDEGSTGILSEFAPDTMKVTAVR
jgi:hypothetical protein